jgi:hypothetical protein
MRKHNATLLGLLQNAHPKQNMNISAARSNEASSCIRLFSAANQTIFMLWMVCPRSARESSISAALIEVFVSTAFAAAMNAA